ncbi:MAG: hypothetical protein JMN24_15420, partial [gamma proteobacterium endosymbiont of Lamellibrachia anaximandri]|nr:hypothetical protein [gamma proteobacterium endosymbiont of Lamellibrachia anaximandri]
TGRRARMPTLLPLWRKARRVSSAASRLPGTTSLRFALHGWQRGKSKREMLKTASVIAHQHHEHFDGSGYPQGLKADEIDIFARIVAVSDVFDALSSDRIYRPAWNDERIYSYFREHRGSKFDPDIVDTFFDALPELLEIRALFSD